MKTLTELLLDCLKNKVVTAYVKDCIYFTGYVENITIKELNGKPNFYFYLNVGLPYLVLEIVPIDNQIRFSAEP
jgi:hypothetical protein